MLTKAFSKEIKRNLGVTVTEGLKPQRKNYSEFWHKLQGDLPNKHVLEQAVFFLYKHDMQDMIDDGTIGGQKPTGVTGNRLNPVSFCPLY